MSSPRTRPGNFVEIVDEAEVITEKIGDSTFRLRRLTLEAAEEIAARHRTRRKDGQGRLYHEIPPERMLEYLADLYDHVILGWSDVVHPVTQAEVPCDRETKMKLHQRTRDRLMERADSDNTAGLRPDPTNGSARPSGGS
jgi:hypothetical protein